MLVHSSIDNLLQAQEAIEKLKQKKPTRYQHFLNIIRLTRQLQFGFQYMGRLLMGEEPETSGGDSSEDYVLTVYKREINKFKANGTAEELHTLLDACKPLSYAAICKLMLGESPRTLVGPAVVR